jgi:hypothetical protein
MSHPKPLLRFRLAIALVGLPLFGAGALAQSANGLPESPSQTSGVAVTLLPGEAVGNEQILRALLRKGTNEFIFMVPDGLRAQSPAGGTVAMISRAMTYSVSVRFVEPAPPQPGLAEALSEQITRQYPHPSSLETFTPVVADHQGAGVQLRQTLTGLNPRLVRILWVPFRAGLVEFALNADGSYAPTGQAALDTVLLTFRSNEGAKLTIIRRSDKT